MHYGEEQLPLMRPEGGHADITRLLVAISGDQPVRHAHQVAEHFTALWQPRVQDALHGVFSARSPGLLERFRLWRYMTKFQRALKKRGLDGILTLEPWRRTW